MTRPLFAKGPLYNALSLTEAELREIVLETSVAYGTGLAGRGSVQSAEWAREEALQRVVDRILKRRSGT